MFPNNVNALMFILFGNFIFPFTSHSVALLLEFCINVTQHLISYNLTASLLNFVFHNFQVSLISLTTQKLNLIQAVNAPYFQKCYIAVFFFVCVCVVRPWNLFRMPNLGRYPLLDLSIDTDYYQRIYLFLLGAIWFYNSLLSLWFCNIGSGIHVQSIHYCSQRKQGITCLDSPIKASSSGDAH